MATKRHVAFTWGKSVAESIKMSSLEFEQNGKKEDDSSKFEILNVSEDLGTEVKDREEQDGGYFDAMMEHNTEESAESIDSFMKKTEKSGEGLESEIRLAEKNDSVEGTNVYGSEEDSSYNINEEIEKESRVMDCEAADIALNDVSMGLSLHDTSEGEGDDMMVNEQMGGDDILSDKVIDDGMASDQENDVIKSKDDDLIPSDEEDYVIAHQGSDGSELLTDDMIATEGGDDVMIGEGSRDSRVEHQEDGVNDLMEGEGTHLESVISGGGESTGSLLDTEYVERKKDITFVKLSDIQIKVDVVEKAGETAVVSGESRDLESLSDPEYLDKKQNDRKEDTALGKTSPVHIKVDMLDKTHTKHSVAEDNMTKSSDQKIECIGESKENAEILKSEAEKTDLMNEEIKGIAATRDGCDNDNSEFQDILTSEELKYNEKCVESENSVDIREPLNKTIATTLDTTICDGGDNVEDEENESKANDRLNELLNNVESENEVRKHKTKNDEDVRTDRGAEEREILGTKDNLIEAVKASRNIAKVDDDTAQKEVVKKEDEKVRVMKRNQHKDLESDQYIDLDESLKKASRTQISVGKEAETDGIVHEMNDTHELASAGQQPASGPLIKKTVSNVERVKRKIEEILEKSKAEEDEFIEEIQQMKKEKTDILHKISSEMKKLKSLLVNEKQEEQK